MTKIITTTWWRRLEYSRRTIYALSACPEAKDYTVLIHIDGPPDPGIVALAKSVQPLFANVLVEPSQTHLGCNGNTRKALEHGFSLGDFVIHVEDDVLVAQDALRYMEWASQFASDQNLFTVSLWRHDKGWLPSTPDKPKPPDTDGLAENYPRFAVWGWGSWADRWEEMKRGWTTGGDMDASWDIVLTEKVRAARCDLSPHCSRAVNIGADLGTHRGDVPLSYWAGSADFVLPLEYKRVL